jgi:hypothetical protein
MWRACADLRLVVHVLMCPHALLYMCPHTAIYMCVLILDESRVRLRGPQAGGGAGGGGPHSAAAVPEERRRRAGPRQLPDAARLYRR